MAGEATLLKPPASVVFQEPSLSRGSVINMLTEDAVGWEKLLGGCKLLWFLLSHLSGGLGPQKGLSTWLVHTLSWLLVTSVNFRCPCVSCVLHSEPVFKEQTWIIAINEGQWLANEVYPQAVICDPSFSWPKRSYLVLAITGGMDFRRKGQSSGEQHRPRIFSTRHSFPYGLQGVGWGAFSSGYSCVILKVE